MTYTDLHVVVQDRNRASVHFEKDGARGHFWLDENWQSKDDTLYKNPPLGTGRFDPSYFNTRQLSMSAKGNRALMAEIKDQLQGFDMVGEAVRAHAAKERAAAAKLRHDAAVIRAEGALFAQAHSAAARGAFAGIAGLEELHEVAEELRQLINAVGEL